MAQNDNGDGGAQPTDAELEADLTPTAVADPTSLPPEQVAAIIKERDTLAAQKNHWRGKAIDPATKKPYRDLLAAAARDNQPKTPPAAAPATDTLTKDVAYLKTVEEKRSFGHQHGLSPEAVDNVFSYAQGRAIKPEEALKDDFVKSGLNALRAKERLASNVPGPSHRSTVVGGKSFSEMKPEDRRSNWSKMTGAER
jgi:hypothetical protein